MDDKKEDILTWICWAIVVAVITLAFLTSCASSRQTPKPTQTERAERIEYRDRVTRDTVYQVDSILVSSRADTVYVTKIRYKYKEHIKTDSLYLFTTDTVIVTQIETVEKALSRWESVKMEVGGIALGVLILALIVALAWVVKKVI